MRLILYCFIFLFFFNHCYAIDTKAEQAIVIDYETNEILFEKNANQKIPPASMTKIMTVYATFDRLKKTNVSIDDICSISPRAYKMEGSRTFLEIDDNVSIENLLMGIIVQSGNDASVALAECLAGTEDDFSKIMNSYAEKIGMINTHFINVSGLPEDNHYSTVYDIAILSNALIRDFPNMYKYFNKKEFTYNNIHQPNRNKLLSNFIGADGLKTGFTKKSGWGIAGSAIKKSRRITVVLNGTNSSRSRLNESTNLLQWSFTQTTKEHLIKAGQVIKNVDVWLGDKPTINLIVDKNIFSIVSFDQLQLMKTSIKYIKPIAAPINKGDIIGEMKITIPGKNIINIPLKAEDTIYNIHPIFRIFAALKYLLFGTSLDEI